MAYERKTGESESETGFEGLPRDVLIGSHPVLLRRRPLDDDGKVPDPDDDPPRPPRPREPVSVPDFAFQFRPCLDDLSFPPEIPAPPGYDFVEAVIAAIRTLAGDQADIRHVCGADRSSHIGVWLFPSSDRDVVAARDRGTRQLRLLRGGETLAVFVNVAFIKLAAELEFNKAPKLLDHDGKESPNGPIHLTSHDVALQPPDKIVTTIRGFDTTPWPDVNFKIKITDTFIASGSEVDIETVNDFDPALGIFILLGVDLLPISPLTGLAFFAEAAIIGSLDPDDRPGAGLAVAQHIPRDIFLEGSIKIVPVYGRVGVTNSGVVAGGGMLVVPRDPALSILGPRSISVSAGQIKVTKAYQANTRDMRRPIRFRWTGAITASDDRAKVTSITFDLTGLEPGKHVSRAVRLTATDADGLTSTSLVSVNIFMANADADETDLPAICKVRPHLPQCHPADL